VNARVTASAAAAKEPLLSRDFLLLVAGQFLQSLGFATLPLVPLYLAAMGAGREEIGAAMATGAIGGLLFRPAVGIALDRIGRKPVVLFGTALLAIAVATLGLTGGAGIPLLVNRVCFGAGVAVLFTSYFALVSDILPSVRRTEGMSIFGIAGILPLTVNPLVAIFEIDGLRLGGFFVAAGVSIALSAVFVALVRERPMAPARPDERVEGLASLGTSALWPTWLASAVFSGQVAVFFAFSTVAAASHGVQDAVWLWFSYAGCAAGVRVVGAWLPDRVGPSNLIAPSIAAYAGAMLLIASSETTVDVLVAGGLAGLAHGYAFPVVTAQVVTRSPMRLRGTALSVYTGIWDVTALTMAPLAGRVSDSLGDGVMLAGAALIALGALVMWTALERVAQRRTDLVRS
jgi:MFS family permease